MILVGMLDSPYVRRVAISLLRMGVPFEHQSVSVFRHYERFQAINPVVKAPSLVCDDGTVLMDSTLILDHVESTLPAERRLMPQEPMARREALRVVGIAMAACEKCVQMIYEKQQRAVVDAKWMARVTGQATTALQLLEESLDPLKLGPGLRRGDNGAAPALDAADIAVAVTWRFTQFYNATEIPAAGFPRLVAFSKRCEELPEFVATPLD